MIAWLAVAAPAAELWWVPNPQTAESLREALRTDWTASPVEVVVGGRPDTAFGWSWDGDTLAVRTAETQRVADADDAHVAVLFARTWNIRTETPGWEQWLPARPPAEAATEPDTVAVAAAGGLIPEPEATALPSAALRSAPPPPSAEERALPDDLELPRHPAPSRRHPERDRRPWTLGLGIGARAMTQVPSAPSLQFPAELTVGAWVLTADLAADPSPWRLGNGVGLVHGVEDLWSATLATGGRFGGSTWMSVEPGVQFRVARPVLASRGHVIAQFDRPVAAGVVDLGIGHDLGFSRVALHT